MRQLATIQQIQEIKAIDGADRIVAARVKDWWVVTQKENFQVGDPCVYFEIDSFLPIIPQFEFLLKGSTKKRMTIDGNVVDGIRLKTIKLKGQISQGLVLPLSEFPQITSTTIGEDISEILGVIKYEIPIPAQLAGKIKGYFPGFIPKTDEERIQNMGEILSGYYVAEKLDGSSVTYYKKDGVFGVCSRNLELKESDDNTFWRIAREQDIENKLPDGFVIQGELVGPGIQGNPLKLPAAEVYFYNVYLIDGGKYLNFIGFKQFCESKGLKTVPIIDDNYKLPESVDAILNYASGKSLVTPTVDREGIVVRPKIEASYKGRRLSFKAISNNYLLEHE